jgi:hypothetical protein
MVSLLASPVVDLGFDPWSGQIKVYKITNLLFLH